MAAALGQRACCVRVCCLVRQLSGGERRRLALALVLGFADLIAQRGRLRCNLIVLDEARPFLVP